MIFAATNFPGSWNDSRVARDSGLYNLLRNTVYREWFLVGDSIFPTTQIAEEEMGGQKIRRPPKENESQPITQNELQLIAARQAAEWRNKDLVRGLPRVSTKWK